MMKATADNPTTTITLSSGKKLKLSFNRGRFAFRYSQCPSDDNFVQLCYALWALGDKFPVSAEAAAELLVGPDVDALADAVTSVMEAAMGNVRTPSSTAGHSSDSTAD